MTEAPRHPFDLAHVDGITIATIGHSEVVTDEDVQRFGDSLATLVEGGGARVVIDLARVKFLPSAALGRLLVLKKRLRAAGGELKLAGVDPNLGEIFRITRLDTLFEIHPDQASAVEKFRRDGVAGNG